MRIEGKTVLIAGGSQGIGFGIAMACAKRTYFTNNAGVEPRLPWIQSAPTTRAFWQTPEEAGTMVVRDTERGRFWSSPLSLKILQILLPRFLRDWLANAGSAPASAGGFPERA